jgi:hypothetical protein
MLNPMVHTVTTGLQKATQDNGKTFSLLDKKVYSVSRSISNIHAAKINFLKFDAGFTPRGSPNR